MSNDDTKKNVGDTKPKVKKTRTSSTKKKVESDKSPQAKAPSKRTTKPKTLSTRTQAKAPPARSKPEIDLPDLTPTINTRGTVGVLGGSGFLGRYVVEHLAKSGYIVKVGSRHAPRALYLKTAAVPGRITLHATDLRSAPSIAAFIQGCDVVINLVGIAFERGTQNFEHIHAQAAQHILDALKNSTVKRYIHVSALGIEQNIPAKYRQTKKAAEDIIREKCPYAVIVRPSLIFGAEDQFFNRFAQMIRLFPFVPVFKGGDTRFQPVYVDDVARGITALIEDAPLSHARIFEFYGPKVYTFRDLLDMLMGVMHKERPIIRMPDIVGYMLSAVSRMLPKPILTSDQLTMLNIDSIPSHTYPGLVDLGITPQSIETILPRYIQPSEQRDL